MGQFLDFILPKICVGCRGEGAWLCTSCEATLKVPGASSCAECLRLTEDAAYCRFHRDDHELTGLIRLGSFHNPVLREAIHTLKYDGITELAQPLGKLLAWRLSTYPSLAKARLIPIPLHAKRERERGFNQAELIADELPHEPLLNCLVRYRSHVAQAKLNRELRKQNMRGVFGIPINQAPRINGQTILLIDDVATTGTTLDTAAALLRRAGANRVWGAVIAYDELKR